ncbi:MAG: APC family permease, partial [Thermoflexales bacterium]|nr:APC family permease [Thermoflexales bacterium]
AGQTTQDQLATLRENLLSSDWNPQQDPLAAANQQPLGTVGQSVAPLAATPDPNSDADGDGLTYLQETRLGTDPNSLDTDGDWLRDDREVKGFSLGGQTWYSDPNQVDTNNDGQLDSQECWGTLPATLPSNQPCDLDTDHDGTPDLFDRDDDGDAVSDRVDLSPGKVLGSGQPFSADNPFRLIIDNVQKNAANQGYPVLVDFQLRPTNADHLAYALNVLDWPGGDDKGQIQRASNTTFADVMSPQPPSGDASRNGDMRLLPMLEIKLTGNTIPLPVTTPRTSVHITGNDGARWISATLNFAQQGANTQIGFQFQDTNSVAAVRLYSGACQDFTNATLIQTFSTVNTGEQRTLNNQALLKVIDGQHAITLSANGHEVCADLGDLPNGPYSDKMIDVDQLRNYGIAVRDADTGGNLVAYVPLNIVQDETGGGKAAFAARMLYWPNNPAAWGNANEVRVVWLLQMLDDSGRTNTVQVYPDQWTLTGLTVREDRGLEMAVAFENPTQDTALTADDRLWQVSRGLQAAWASGRDSDRNGQRDLTLADFKARFDNVNNDATALKNRWNIPSGAIKVLTYAYATQDGLIKVPTELTPQILRDYFTNGGQPRTAAPTLLFAREERYRTASLDMADGVIVVSGNQATVNMAADKVSVDTLVSTNWAPYRYRGGAWEAYPVAEYYDALGQQIKDTLRPRYAAESADALDGAALSASAYYMTMIFGVSRVVQSGNLVLEDRGEADSDASVGQVVVDQVGGVLDYAAGAVAEDYFSILQLGEDASGKPFPIPTTARGKLGVVGGLIKGKLSDFASSTWRQKATTLADPAGSALGAAALGLSLSSAVAGGTAGTVIDRITEGLEVLSAAKDLMESVNKFKEVTQGITGIFNKIKAATANTQKAASKAGLVGLVISIGVSAGAFIAQWASGAFGSFWSLQFNAALAGTIATIVAAVIMFAIASIPIVGQIIAAVIALIDAVIAGICGLIDAVADDAASNDSVGQWFCKGISGLVAEGIAWAIYSQNSLVGNMDDADRTRLSNFTPTLVDPAQGFVVNNTVNYQLSVETALTLADVPIDWKAAIYFWQFSYSNLDSATFRHALQADKTGIDGVERNQMEDDWQRKDGYFDGEDALVISVPLAANDVLGETGINRPAKLYLTEAYAVPTQECWVIPVPPLGVPLIPVCYIRTDDNDGESKFTDLGKTVQWDVLPTTLDDFYACESGDLKHACHKDGGYSLAWGQGKDHTLTFPRMIDFDGDGLINPVDGGNDPNDSKWDSDRDGLSDPFEIQRGSDPTLYDADEDGLSDYDEA